MGAPKFFRVFFKFCVQLKSILLIIFFKRQHAVRAQQEQDDTSRVYVTDLVVAELFISELWGPVISRTSAQKLFFSNVSDHREIKVDNLELEIFVKHEVLKLDVEVGYSVIMEVFYRGNELMEICSGSNFV